MRRESFPVPGSVPLRARIFAEDLMKGCRQIFDTFPDRRRRQECDGRPLEVVVLPITIPVDPAGSVVLRPDAPGPDSVRRPARLEVARAADTASPYPFAIGFALEEGAMSIPGVRRAGAGSPDPLPVAEMTFALCGRGAAVSGFGPDGRRLDLDLDEDTARQLATALHLTIGMKLAKAERGWT